MHTYIHTHIHTYTFTFTFTFTFTYPYIFTYIHIHIHTHTHTHIHTYTHTDTYTFTFADTYAYTNTYTYAHTYTYTYTYTFTFTYTHIYIYTYIYIYIHTIFCTNIPIYSCVSHGIPEWSWGLCASVTWSPMIAGRRAKCLLRDYCARTTLLIQTRRHRRAWSGHAFCLAQRMSERDQNRYIVLSTFSSLAVDAIVWSWARWLFSLRLAVFWRQAAEVPANVLNHPMFSTHAWLGPEET